MKSSDILPFLKRRPLQVVCGVVAILFAASIYFRSGKLEENQTLLDTKSAEGEKISANIKNGAGLKEQLEGLTAATAQIESRLIQAGSLGLNLQFFYRLEAETGVKYVDLRQQSTPILGKGAKTNYIAVPFAVTVQGTFQQVFDFLGRLESGSHFFHLKSA